MVRTFLVALRASTAIAVQICANSLLSALAVVERSRSCQNAHQRLRSQQKIIFVSREVWSSAARCESAFARQITLSC